MVRVLGVLEQLRRERGLTQAEMAEVIGISQGQYSTLVRGVQEVTLDKLLKIVRAVPETRGIFLSEVIQPTNTVLNEETGERIGCWVAVLREG